MLASNHDVNMTAEIKPLVAVGQDTMATNTGPVAMQSNPSYGVAVGQNTMVTNTGPVAMQSNPSYGVAVRKDVISATNV